MNRRFGLRFWGGGTEFRLQQIAGGGRILLRDMSTGRLFWRAPPLGVQWEIYCGNDGHSFDSEAAAQSVSENLRAAGAICQ